VSSHTIQELGAYLMNGVYETLTPEQRRQRAANAGRAGHSPESMAGQIARQWPDLSEERRQEVISRLAPISERVDR
jgi:hypothetical protein